MHGTHAPSMPQKALLTANHVAAVALAGWLLFGGGVAAASGWLGAGWPPADLLRRMLLLGGSLVYFARVCFTGF